MGLIDFIVLAAVAIVLSLSIRYIVKAKKAGVKCIGCSVGSCSAGKKSDCKCHHD